MQSEKEKLKSYPDLKAPRPDSKLYFLQESIPR